jgi:cytochrome c2
MDSALTLYARLSGLFAALMCVCGFHLAIWGLHRHPTLPALYVPAGNFERGRVLLREKSCGACHTIPGVRGAVGAVGPRLDRMQKQMYIAGVLANTPENLIHWITNPREADPRTAMPDLDISDQDARDIAAYLYRIR